MAGMKKNADKGIVLVSIGPKEWRELVRKYPAILYPYCYSLKDALRVMTLGRCRWQHLSTLRRIYSRGNFLTVQQFIPIVSYCTPCMSEVYYACTV
jgi:hypothetical protein